MIRLRLRLHPRTRTRNPRSLEKLCQVPAGTADRLAGLQRLDAAGVDITEVIRLSEGLSWG